MVQSWCYFFKYLLEFSSITIWAQILHFGVLLNEKFSFVNSYGGGSGGLVAKSCPTLEIPWTIACQAPLSMGFSRQEYWSGLSFPSLQGYPNYLFMLSCGSLWFLRNWSISSKLSKLHAYSCS